MNFSLKIIKNESLIKNEMNGEKITQCRKEMLFMSHTRICVIEQQQQQQKDSLPWWYCPIKIFLRKKMVELLSRVFHFFFKLCSVWYSQKSFALWKHYHHFSTTYVIAGSFYLEKKRFLRLRFLFILKFMFNIQFSNKKFFYWNFI